MIDSGTATSQPLTILIQKAVERNGISLPPLPELVTRLTQILEDEARASSKQIAQLVRNEPAVAATVLRMANSVVFGGLHPISDLSQAIARLGFKQVTSVVTAISHRGHFKSEDPVKKTLLQTLWSHAVATALAAKRLAGPTGGDPEEAFVAGLLHDAGKLLVLKGVDHLENQKEPVQVTPVVLDELMDVLHAELGHKTLVAWRLPEPICNVALHHHDDDLEACDPLTIRVQAADAVARKIGEHPKPEPDLDLLDQPAVEHLNLSDIELASLIVDLEDEIAEVKRLI
jgi:HD-like signal output (HDOD) protein